MDKLKFRELPNLISLSGKSGNGKDTVEILIQSLLTKGFIDNPNEVSGRIGYELLENQERLKDVVNLSYFYGIKSYKNKKFADKLKDIVCLLIGCTRGQLENREFKEKELGEEWWYYYSSFYDNTPQNLEPYIGFKPKQSKHKYHLMKLTPRKLMQLLGTECGRQILHPNIWCNSLFSDYYGDIEQWVDIKGYEGLYQVSSYGNVKSLDREIVYGDRQKGEYHNRKGQLLKPTLSGGYKTVSLSSTTYTVHSLVAKHFLEFIDGDYVVNHIDYDKTNNFYKNLEYVTQGDNVRHNYVTGNANIGTKQKDAKLNDDNVLKIKKLLETNLSQAKIAKQFGVSPTTITDIKKGRKWKHVGKEKIVIKPILPTSPPNWIITDTRFLSEINAIDDRGGLKIKIERPYKLKYPKLWTEYTLKSNNINDEGFIDFVRIKDEELYKVITHKSETELDEYEDWDYVLVNDGSLSDLLLKVYEMLKKISEKNK